MLLASGCRAYSKVILSKKKAKALLLVIIPPWVVRVKRSKIKQ